MHNPMIERLIQPRAFVSQNALGKFNLRASQEFEGAPGMPGIWIRRPNHYFLYSGGDDGIGAGRRAPMRRTGFERDIERRPARIVVMLPGIAERFDFRVGQPRAMMPAVSNNAPALDQHSPDHPGWAKVAP